MRTGCAGAEEFNAKLFQRRHVFHGRELALRRPGDFIDLCQHVRHGSSEEPPEVGFGLLLELFEQRADDFSDEFLGR